MKKIWQLLLPGTPLPACDAPENSTDEEHEGATPSHSGEKPQPKPGAR